MVRRGNQTQELRNHLREQEITSSERGRTWPKGDKTAPFFFFFFLIFLFIYLAELDLSCSMQDLPLWHVGSSSLTRGGTRGSLHWESWESQPLYHQGSPDNASIMHVLAEMIPQGKVLAAKAEAQRLRPGPAGGSESGSCGERHAEPGPPRTQPGAPKR